jgi:cyclic pyranopterin phosphate synthase
MGIRHVRLTGGEPTLRKGLISLIQRITDETQLSDLSMTTNGLLLDRLAKPLADAGLKRLNISIDSLDAERFKLITRGSDLKRVLRGIDAAIEAGFKTIKLNLVLLKDHNENEIIDFIDLCARYPDILELRCIEYMPFQARKMASISVETVKKQLRTQFTLIPLENHPDRGPASQFLIQERNVRVGFISPLSNSFCSTCNRLRLMANGALRSCLSLERQSSLRDLIRGEHSTKELEELIQKIVWNKVDGHHCLEKSGTPFEGTMTRIGG